MAWSPIGQLKQDYVLVVVPLNYPKAFIQGSGLKSLKIYRKMHSKDVALAVVVGITLVQAGKWTCFLLIKKSEFNLK